MGEAKKSVETRWNGDTGYRAGGVPVACPPAVTERANGMAEDIQNEGEKKEADPCNGPA